MTLHEILTYCIENSVSIPRLCQQKGIDHLTIKRQLAKGCEPELYAKYKNDIVRIYSAMKRRKKGCRLIEDVRANKKENCGCIAGVKECKKHYDESLLAEFGMRPNENESSFDRVYMFKFGFGL